MSGGERAKVNAGKGSDFGEIRVYDGSVTALPHKIKMLKYNLVIVEVPRRGGWIRGAHIVRAVSRGNGRLSRTSWGFGRYGTALTFAIGRLISNSFSHGCLPSWTQRRTVFVRVVDFVACEDSWFGPYGAALAHAKVVH